MHGVLECTVQTKSNLGCLLGYHSSLHDVGKSSAILIYKKYSK